MTGSSIDEVRMPQDKPPAWANSVMSWALRTPGLQTMVGREVALLSFIGRNTGQSYTIPVSYQREGDMVTVVTKKLRNWWRNFETPAEVELRLAGLTYSGKAEVIAIDEEALDFMTQYLEKRPIDAKAYGLNKDEIIKDKIAKIIPHIVVIRIELSPAP